MTDNEIIKALECCVKTEFISDCAKCEMFAIDCKDILIENALDLINRQKAEIERLQAMHKEMCVGMKVLKRKAIKEFAERLKRVVAVHNGDMWSKYEYIDNLVKEMMEVNKNDRA
jgi:hypothetical protein